MNMTRDHSQNSLFANLGFFMQGIPAIFIQAEIVYIADPNMSHYVNTAMSQYINTAAEKSKPDFSTDVILKGYELFITFNHELKHFHDALLSRPLFKLFMLQNARLWHILQLPNQISNLSEADLPFRDGKAIRANVSPFGRFLINEVHNSDRAYLEQQRRLYRRRPCLGNLTISLVDLLEANAIAAELLNLLVAHDVLSAEKYYRRVVCNLPSEYNKLLNTFVALAGDFVRALVDLHLAVSYCLYGSDDPVAHFCMLADEYVKSPDSFTDRYSPQAIRHLFDGEAELEKWVKGHKLVDLKRGGEVVVRTDEEDWAEKLTRFHEHIYYARKALIAKYVDEFQMNASDYFHRTNELPLPPVVFWPAAVRPDGQATVVREDIFRHHGLEFYMLRGGKDARGNNVILAGIGPYMLQKPFMEYEQVDMHMLAYYWYRMLFGKRDSEVYTPLIDKIYNDAFVKFFSLESGEPQ